MHVRMARAALNWTVRDLADRAGVNKNTVVRYEAGKGILLSTLQSLEKVLSDEGVVFFEGDAAHGTGVGLRENEPAAAQKGNLKKRSQKA